MSWLHDFFFPRSKEDIIEDYISRSERQRSLRRIKGRRIIKKFEDKTATYVYILQEYKNYGWFGILFDESGDVFKWLNTDYSGDIKWAKKVAKHYNCKIVNEDNDE